MSDDGRAPFGPGVASAHFVVAFYAMVCFYVWPDANSELQGFVASLPHYPVRGLRWIGAGDLVDVLQQPWDAVVVALPSHRHVLATALLLTALVFLKLIQLCDSLREWRDRPLNSDRSWARRIGAWLPRAAGQLGVTLGLFAASASALSSMWSGMFLLRAHERWLEEDDEADTTPLLRDLMFSNDSLSARTALRTLDRFFSLGDSPGSLGDSPGPPEVVQTFEAIARALESKPTRNLNVEVVFSALVLSMVSMREQSEIAARGRGGDPKQSWRELRFVGPTGSPIRVRTNFLQPSHRARPLIGRAKVVADIWDDFVKRSGEMYRGFSPQCTQSAKSLREAAGDRFLPTDILVRVAYNAIASYCLGQRFLGELLGLKFAEGDLYGELVITLHNSEESYSRQSPDILADGVYLARENQILFWEDEISMTRSEAQQIIAVAGRTFQTREFELDLEDPEIRKIAFAVNYEGIHAVMSHELWHWVIHALLAERLGGETLPACLDEGFASWLDYMFLEGEKRLAGSDFIPGKRERTILDLPRLWLRGREVASTPRGSMKMVDELYNGTVERRREAYAECFALAALFGPMILHEGAYLREPAARDDAVLRAPWREIRDSILRRDPMWSAFPPGWAQLTGLFQDTP